MAELVGPSDNGRRVDYLRHPTLPVFLRDLSAKLGGNIRVIEPDLLLDDAPVPDSMEVGFGAWPRDRDQVSAAVIVKGDMQRLMDVADPMPKAFKEPKLIAHIEAEGKIAGVVQDRGDDATIGNRARMRNLDDFR